MEDNRILFKTNTTLCAQSFREMYFHYFFLRISSIIIFVVFGSYFLFAASMALYYLIAFGIFYVNYIILACVFLLFMSYRPIQYLIYRKSANSNFPDTDTPETVDLIIIDGKILNERGVEVFSLYSVRKAYVLKSIIYLVAPGKRIIFLSRNGFYEGSEENLLSYLSSRNIKVTFTKASKSIGKKDE